MRKVIYWLTKLIAPPLMFAFIRRINGLGNIPKKGAYIIAANHGSAFDTIAIPSIIVRKFKRKVHYVSKKELFKSYFAREFFIGGGCIPVDREKIITSTEAMTLEKLPKEMIIVGAGAIGVEFAYFYNVLGTKVTLVEMLDRIVPVEDSEVSETLKRSFAKRGIEIYTSAKVENAQVKGRKVDVNISNEDGKKQLKADIVLSAVGVVGNVEGFGLEKLGVKVERNSIVVDKKTYKTNIDNIYAVGFVDSSNVRKGIIYHYNGKEWSRVNIAFTTATLTRIKRGLKTSENYFIRGIVESNYVEDTTKIFEFNGNSLVQLYSAINLKNNTNFLQNINSEVVFVIGYSLNVYTENRGFRKFLDINNQNFGIQIFGRTEKDIFLRMENGIAHYDGNNIKYLYTFSEKDNIADGIIFKNEVFFLANNFSQGLNIIYKGILE